MLFSRRGFALIEALVVLGLIGILLSIATPYYQVYMQNASYRAAAREIAATLRQARAEAVTRNRQHLVNIDFKNNQIQMDGRGWQTFSRLVDLGRWDGNQCLTAEDDLDLNFFPNGTANTTAGICILNRAGERRFLVQLTSRTTGHVAVGR